MIEVCSEVSARPHIRARRKICSRLKLSIAGWKTSLKISFQIMLKAHPGFDEYRISGEVLGHDPYVLASALSAIYGENTHFRIM